jgi:hypothetical protein
VQFTAHHTGTGLNTFGFRHPRTQFLKRNIRLFLNLDADESFATGERTGVTTSMGQSRACASLVLAS